MFNHRILKIYNIYSKIKFDYLYVQKKDRPTRRKILILRNYYN